MIEKNRIETLPCLQIVNLGRGPKKKKQQKKRDMRMKMKMMMTLYLFQNDNLKDRRNRQNLRI